MPKPRLKELQRRILSGILDRIPVHAAVHGFVKGRSIVSFAAPHAGKAVLLRLDLQDFFPDISRRARAGTFSNARLSGEGRRPAGRDLHECGCARCVERPAAGDCGAGMARSAERCTRGRICRRALRPRRRSPTLWRTAWIAADRVWPRRRARCTRDTPTTWRSPADEEFAAGRRAIRCARRGGGAGRRLQRQSPQDSYHAPGRSPATGGSCGESEGESAPARSRIAGGDADELRAIRAGIAESRGGAGLPRALGGSRRVRRDGESRRKVRG